jgi:hypothetical protein
MIKFNNLLKYGLYNLMAIAITFVIIEGLASIAIMVYKIHTRWYLTNRTHTQYDDTLGWVNLANIYIKNMYGPGIYFKSDGQGFRNNNEISQQNHGKKVRIICSGDSFTFGIGVDNDHTWCSQLASINQKLETINMGQEGYGIDQAYLWYKRDGSKLTPDIHIFAFITQDFYRMQQHNYFGYSKPILDLQDNVLVIHNVPVPQPSFYIWLDWLDWLKKDNNKTRKIALNIFQDMDKIDKKGNGILLLVYLPTKTDYLEQESEPWRQFLHDWAAKQNLLFIDLIPEFRKLQPQTMEALFIKKGFLGVAGHYTEAGNSYIAQVLSDKLSAIPEISAKMTQK